MSFVPTADRFWGSSPSGVGRWFLFGAPLDLTGSGRLGTRHGPAEIRRASHNIESFSPKLGVDLFDAGLVDLGDLDLASQGVELALQTIEHATADVLNRGRPLLLGGEHTLTLAAFRAVRRRYPDALLITLDAHLDLADQLEGRRLSHGTWAARLGDEFGLGCLAILGVRSGTRAEWELARSCAWVSGDLDLGVDLLAGVANRAVYLSIDIDVVDPSAAPGTGCPEPGGPTSSELLEFIHSLRGVNVAGMDLNEVLPEGDPAGITAALAAKLIREGVLLSE